MRTRKFLFDKAWSDDQLEELFFGEKKFSGFMTQKPDAIIHLKFIIQETLRCPNLMIHTSSYSMLVLAVTITIGGSLVHHITLTWFKFLNSIHKKFLLRFQHDGYYHIFHLKKTFNDEFWIRWREQWGCALQMSLHVVIFILVPNNYTIF